MDDVKNLLKFANNNFIFVDIKKRSDKDIPILDMEEDIWKQFTRWYTTLSRWNK